VVIPILLDARAHSSSRDPERYANRLSATHWVTVRQRSRTRRPAAAQVTGSVNTCWPHTGRAGHKPRTREYAKRRMPIKRASSRFSAQARPARADHPGLRRARVTPPHFAQHAGGYLRTWSRPTPVTVRELISYAT
jgi:hypothetical protein